MGLENSGEARFEILIFYLIYSLFLSIFNSLVIWSSAFDAMLINHIHSSGYLRSISASVLIIYIYIYIYRIIHFPQVKVVSSRFCFLSVAFLNLNYLPFLTQLYKYNSRDNVVVRSYIAYSTPSLRDGYFFIFEIVFLGSMTSDIWTNKLDPSISDLIYYYTWEWVSILEQPYDDAGLAPADHPIILWCRLVLQSNNEELLYNPLNLKRDKLAGLEGA